MIKIATIYELKPRFQALLHPLVGWLASNGVTANQVTIAAALLSIAAGTTIALQPSAAWPLALLPLVLFLRMALNAIDGMLAREHDMQSALGGMLNELGDVISDTALYLPLALVPGIDPVLVVLVVLLAVCTELAGVVAVQIGAQRRYDGPMGKSDRAFVFGTLGLVLALGVQPGVWLDGLLAIVLALLILTITNRARRAIAGAP
jgi:CDP-diacylglycerol--glycerol-3-phosphate 3-phosphatidyltransferase